MHYANEPMRKPRFWLFAQIDALTEEVKARDRQLAEAGNAAAKASAREQQLGQQLSKTEKLLKGSQVGASGHVPHDLHTLFTIFSILAQSYFLNCIAILAVIALV